MLRKAERDSLLRGISICRGGPRISHLFFADDSIIFCKASHDNCGALQTILTSYANASGQVVNGDKTAIFFSYNTPMQQRESLAAFMGTSIATQFDKYLGLPAILGHSKKWAFSEIKERIWRRLQGWKEKLLSQSGREILIKAVVQAIPTYAMSCFMFLAELCAEISSMAIRFWWGQKDGERKIHWLSKQKLMKAKKEGGIGFRDIALFNKALLAKQAWRLLQNPSSLVCRMLKAKYFPHTPFLEATVPNNASYLWRSICDSKVVLKAGLRWRVGNGELIKIWKDKWLPCPTTYRVISPRQVLEENATVERLINRDTMQWRGELLDSVFLPRDAEIIRAIPLSARQPRDCLIWSGTKRGLFTVKSAYNMLISQARAAEASTSSSSSGESHLWSSIWSASVPPKVRTFMWRACKDILPTQTKLFEKRCIHTYTCLWCCEEAETSDHVLWQCEFAQKVWKECPARIRAHYDERTTFKEFILSCFKDLASPAIEIVLTTAWSLWRARNALQWENKCSNVSEICLSAAGLALDFLESGQLLNDTSCGASSVWSQWKSPAPNHYKLNVAYSLNSGHNLAGLGVLVRDSSGDVAVALCTRLRWDGDVFQAHARSLLIALQFAYDAGLRNLEVDVGCQELLGLISMGSPCFASMGVLVDDICHWHLFFEFLSFSFIKKDCNKAVCALATEALSSHSEQVWLEDHPACISSFVQFDSLQ